MDYRYANRGRSLEELMAHANDYYRSRGMGIVHKIPTEFIPLRDRRGKVAGVKVTHKATVDFIGRWLNAPLAVEAKNTSSGAIRIDAVQEHQANDLDEWISEPDAIGLVVVSFGYERFFAVPWEFWSVAYDVRIRQADRASHIAVKYEDARWKVPEKMSIRAEELLPEWEVYLMPWGLDYMGWWSREC